MKMCKAYKRFIIKKGDPLDQKQLMSLLDEMPPMGILSKGSVKFKKTFLSHLLKNPLGTIVIAVEQKSKKIIGYVIAIRHPLCFWKNMALSSASFTLIILSAKKIANKLLSILKKMPGSLKNFKKISVEKRHEFKWSPSDPKIARIIFIGILSDFRGLGIGESLYLFLSETLREEKCIKIEAHIDEGNMPSLKLHRKNGWNIEEMCQENYKATLNLKK